jgi:methylmalonyl-CoA mutase cobalamin-binding domain/chain
MEKRLKPETSELNEERPENTGAALQSLRLRTLQFFERHGRRPRILVGALQRQESTYPAEQLGSLLAELGFDVDLQPVLKHLDQLAAMALDNDVHAVVILGVRRESESMLRGLIQAVAAGGGEDILLALDHPGVCDRLRQDVSHPLAWLPDGSWVSAARLLDAIDRIR